MSLSIKNFSNQTNSMVENLLTINYSIHWRGSKSKEDILHPYQYKI